MYARTFELVPLLSGQLLQNGAWLLVRIRRRDEYLGVRAWEDEARAVRGAIAAVVQDMQMGARTKEDALAELEASQTGAPDPIRVANVTGDGAFTEMRYLREASGEDVAFA